ncbi:MAG TPA: hypothetical protein VHA56_16900 [Mucilaginibacter sp.]|nr:hypothetical protein [Mucilaginibacter sp.]
MIESELLKSFKKIDYNNDDNFAANELFGKKLRAIASQYPATIAQKFPLLEKAGLDIATSDDGLFRIYSWDTWTGGTMHFFENVLQYKTGAKTVALLDTPKDESDNRPNYKKIYTLKTPGQTYYLCTYQTIASSKDVGQGLQVFAIENGKLNNDVKLIKSQGKLQSQLYYDFDFFSVADWKVRPSINYDAATQTIHLPQVAANGSVTHKEIRYKFNGSFFEIIKN